MQSPNNNKFEDIPLDKETTLSLKKLAALSDDTKTTVQHETHQRKAGLAIGTVVTIVGVSALSVGIVLVTGGTGTPLALGIMGVTVGTLTTAGGVTKIAYDAYQLAHIDPLGTFFEQLDRSVELKDSAKKVSTLFDDYPGMKKDMAVGIQRYIKTGDQAFFSHFLKAVNYVLSIRGDTLQLKAACHGVAPLKTACFPITLDEQLIKDKDDLPVSDGKKSQHVIKPVSIPLR